ncbi:MAG: hypothetical protein ABJB04_08035, partial [Betaproteobacteria bacterium]
AYRTGFAQALRPFLAGSQSVSMAEVKVADVAGIIDAASLLAVRRPVPGPPDNSRVTDEPQ